MAARLRKGGEPPFLIVVGWLNDDYTIYDEKNHCSYKVAHRSPTGYTQPCIAILRKMPKGYKIVRYKALTMEEYQHLWLEGL